MNKHVVSAQWLQEHLNMKNLVILDASPVIADTSVENCIIPNAIHFDIKGKFSNLSSSLPNTIPSIEQFQEACRAIGINSNSQIVVYDHKGIYTSPRVWWMFRVMGHENVAVLDGGIPSWINAGYGTQNDFKQNIEYGNFIATYDRTFVKSYEDVKANIEKQSFQIIDARSKGRFDGTASEPRKNLKSGHIPNSSNLPYTEVLSNGEFKSDEDLRSLFKDIIKEDENTVYSCGSGITACIIMMAASIAGYKSLKLYDGSWTEWAIKEGLTIKSQNG